VLPCGGGKGQTELVRRARFGQETEDLALVDRRDGRLHISLTREQHPHGIGGQLTGLGQERRAVHHRHPHVREHDGEGALLSERFETQRPTGGGHDITDAPELQREPLQYLRLVIHAQDLGQVFWFIRQMGRYVH